MYSSTNFFDFKDIITEQKCQEQNYRQHHTPNIELLKLLFCRLNENWPIFDLRVCQLLIWFHNNSLYIHCVDAFIAFIDEN